MNIQQVSIALTLCQLVAFSAVFASPVNKTLDSSNLARLRKMYSESSDLAHQSLHELLILKHLINESDDSNSTKLEGTDLNASILPLLENLAKHNEARQSSLFNSFKLPASQPFANPFGTYNPLMNNLLKPPSLPTLPMLPTLPTFQLPSPRPSRPPKSSIIGNNGGSMALTNDNVVVVNVLSNNY